MPYIKQAERTILANETDTARTAGELNHEICQLVIGYIAKKHMCYQTINDVVGALEGAKAEFQRRVVGPYEDSKINENGDIAWPLV